MRFFYLPLIFLLPALSVTACGGSRQAGLDPGQARMVDEYTPPFLAPPAGEALKITVPRPAGEALRLLSGYADSPQAVYVAESRPGSQEPGRSSVVFLLFLPDPEQCLDCGNNNFSYYYENDLVKQWIYPVARREVRMEFAPDDVLSRYMTLTARAEAVVLPLTRESSEIRLEVDYTLERRASASTRRQTEGNAPGPVFGLASARFSSGQTGDLQDEVQCVSKGVVEAELLKGIAEIMK
ncbi:MAG: hypothetical protein LBJ14_07055 [Desulfarculales bacterium]|jgi:hypothetical protein|nr:hypothetical protein [Desulfarculales bacterium]